MLRPDRKISLTASEFQGLKFSRTVVMVSVMGANFIDVSISIKNLSLALLLSSATIGHHNQTLRTQVLLSMSREI